MFKDVLHNLLLDCIVFPAETDPSTQDHHAELQPRLWYPQPGLTFTRFDGHILTPPIR